MSNAYRKGFQEGVTYAADKLREDLIAAIAATIVETRKQCAEVCRNNGHDVSAVEIEQMCEAKH